eukprot:53753-Eustigmatos_ZCMA.PRE.1
MDTDLSSSCPERAGAYQGRMTHRPLRQPYKSRYRDCRTGGQAAVGQIRAHSVPRGMRVTSQKLAPCSVRT